MTYLHSLAVGCTLFCWEGQPRNHLLGKMNTDYFRSGLMTCDTRPDASRRGLIRLTGRSFQTLVTIWRSRLYSSNCTYGKLTPNHFFLSWRCKEVVPEDQSHWEKLVFKCSGCETKLYLIVKRKLCSSGNEDDYFMTIFLSSTLNRSGRIWSVSNYLIIF